MPVSVALIISSAFLLVSGLLLFGWPALVRGGYDSVQDWWDQPEQRVFVAILIAGVIVPIALSFGPLVGGDVMVHEVQTGLTAIA